MENHAFEISCFPSHRGLTSSDFRWANGWSSPPRIADKLNVNHSTGEVEVALPQVRLDDRLAVLNLIKSCRRRKDLWRTRKVHADVLKRNLIAKDVYLATALITAYAACGVLDEAQHIFEQIPTQDVVTWSALISGYAQNGLMGEAFRAFIEMRNKGICPDAVTYVSVLKVCGITGSVDIGESIHAAALKQGLLQKDMFLGTALVDMYSKCGAFKKAQEAFEQLPVISAVSWNALIAGYVQHRLGDEALKCFRRMLELGVCPDAITYSCVLKACGIVGSLEIGENIDAKVRNKVLLQEDIVLGTTLVDMYCKCDMLDRAQEVFEQLPKKNVVSWNALLTGYARQGLCDEALEYFKRMQNEGVRPDSVTYICILKTCGIAGCLEAGYGLDVTIRKQGLLQKDIMLGNALVDMYCKCGALERAKGVFDQLPTQNVVTWSALIAGYSQLGQAIAVLDMYRKMKAEGVVPNSVTFIVLLSACSHAGLVKEGENMFNEMCIIFSLTPTVEHYACMIDLFGRAGQFDKVRALLENVRQWDHLVLFLNVLGACLKWRNVQIGRWAFEHSLRLDEKCVVAYICMENIYASAGMHLEADRIQGLRMKNKAWKMPIFCWTETT